MADPSTFAAQNPNRTYNVYFYDSVNGGGAKYDRAIVSPVGKTGAAPSITSKVGDFLPVKLRARTASSARGRARRSATTSS